MSDHLTDDQLRRFVSGEMPPSDRLAGDDHLAGCEACRARAAARLGAQARAADVLGGVALASAHLSDADVQAYVAGGLDGPDLARVRDHLAVCAACAAEVDELRAWARPARRARRAWAYAVAASVALASLIPLASWYRSTPASPAGAALAGIDRLPADDQARVQRALADGRVEVPERIAALAGRRDVLMGPGQTASFRVISPLATAVVDDRPVLSWSPLAGADGYDVAVFDERWTPIVERRLGRTTTYVPADPLPRGRVYGWQVTARRGADRITTPAAPLPPARFEVLDQAAADLLRRMEREPSASPLLLGMLYLQAGVLEDAERHFRRVDRPSDTPLARQALERLAAHARRVEAP